MNTTDPTYTEETLLTRLKEIKELVDNMNYAAVHDPEFPTLADIKAVAEIYSLLTYVVVGVSSVYSKQNPTDLRGT